MRILELFAGTASFSNAAVGHTTFISDNDPQFDTDYCVDIMEFDTSKVPFKPDVIWASPPCETFSVASIGHHWTGDSKARVPKTKEAEIGIDRVAGAIDIIKELKPKYWYIENPRGMLRKLIPELLDERLGNFWVCRTVTYCQYGDARMKPTDIWTNDLNWQPRPMCKNGDPCHVAAPRGSQTGTQGIKTYKDRSRIPQGLCIEILDGLEAIMTPPKDTTPNPSQDELREQIEAIKYPEVSGLKHYPEYIVINVKNMVPSEVLDAIMSLIVAHTEEKVREARINSLLALEEFIKLHDLNAEAILYSIEHMVISTIQFPDQPHREYPDRIKALTNKGKDTTQPNKGE